MIQVADEEDFPVGHMDKWHEIYEACRQLRDLPKGCLTITLGKLNPHHAQRKCHVAFQADRTWRIKTKVRDGILWIRKEKIPTKKAL